MMVKRSLIIMCFLCFLGTAYAQEKTDTAKLDTVLSNQETMMQNQEKILREVTYHDPLADKTWGIEFNPAYLLAASGEDELVLSGGFSLFNVNRHAEIAFPIFYRSSDDNDVATVFSVEAHYRFFLGEHQGGFYLSASGTYHYVKGEEDLDGISFIDLTPGGEVITLNKLGIGFGIGYRKFSHRGLYWGTSLTLGRYFTGIDRQVEGDLFHKVYVDFEFLKFGFAF